MKVGINIMAIVLGLYLYQNVSSNEIFRGSKAISPCSDTILVEDVDASDLILSYRFDYIENDTLASDKLIKEQVEFLMQMKLPSDGIQEAEGIDSFDYEALFSSYDQTLRQLQHHPFKDLYRQISSQMLVKYLCSREQPYSQNLRNEKLLFFINEMKKGGGINLGLFYTSFLKLQYGKKNEEMCEEVQIYLPYCDSLYKRKENEVSGIKETKEMLPGDRFILLDLRKRLAADREYIMKLNLIKEKTCI